MRNKTHKLLYVEDNDDNWFVVRKALQKTYHVSRAPSFEAAMVELLRESWDLVLLDIDLAGSELNGLDILQWINRSPGCAVLKSWPPFDGEKPTVAIVSAYTDRYSPGRLRAMGAASVIEKPISHTLLLLKVSRLLLSGLSTGDASDKSGP